MPRRLLGIFLLLLVSASVVQAQGDAVLFTVGPEAVGRGEFEYHLGKSPEKRADVFVETYAQFKQKVLYARELGLDTLPDYRRRVESGRELLKREPEKDAASVRPAREWVKLVHYTYPLKQSAGQLELQRGMAYMDSLRSVLKEGTDVPEGESAWRQIRHLLNEWQDRLAGLAKDEYSEPFCSPWGIHIIAWKERKSGQVLKTGRVPADEALRMQELEEGLLAVTLDEYWERVLACTEQDLKLHFKEHRARYGGGTPHFRGAVIHCQDKKEAKAIRKYLKKYPQAFWQEAAARMPAEISKAFRLDVGIYAIGENPYVDKLVFRCGEFEPLADCPYTWVMGKKLKDGPTDYRDVRPKVEKDCREAKKKDEMEALRLKYRVEINKEVLKSVNCAGNK